MKTHVFLDFERTGHRILTSTITLPQVVRDVRFIELAEYSPSAVFFVFSCDIIDQFFTNDDIGPLLAFRLSGTGETQKMPVDPCNSNVRDLTDLMFHKDRAPIYQSRRLIARAHVILHSGDLRMTNLIDMKVKHFMLKVYSTDDSDKVHSTNYRIPVPIFNAKFLKILNWFYSGGTDYITSNMIHPTFTTDPLVNEPVVAFGVGGVSKPHEPMPLSHETINEVTLSMQRVGGVKFHRDHSYIQFCILYN